MKRILAALLALVLLTQAAYAGTTTLAVPSGSGTFREGTDGSANLFPQIGICDGAACAALATVKAASTAPVSTDTTIVVGVNPGTIGGSAGLPLFITPGTGATFSNNVTQWDGTSLGVPTAYGTAPTTGNYIGVNAYVTNYQTSVTHFSEIVQNNTTAISVKASAGTLYELSLGGVGSGPAYVKFYDAASATCGSGTPAYRFIIPAASTAANGAGSNVPIPPQGIAFTTGIQYCVTGGIADSDTTAPAASSYLVNGAYQ